MISKVTLIKKSPETTGVLFNYISLTTVYGSHDEYRFTKDSAFDDYTFDNFDRNNYTAVKVGSPDVDITQALRANNSSLSNTFLSIDRFYLPGSTAFSSGDTVRIQAITIPDTTIASMTNVQHTLRKDLQSCYDSDSTSSWNKYKQTLRRTSIQVDRFSNVELLSEFYDVNDKESFLLELEMRTGFKIKGNFVASTFNENGSADLRTDNITFDSVGEIVKV